MPTQYQKYRLAISILSKMASTPNELKSKYPISRAEIASVCGVSSAQPSRWKDEVPKSHVITLGIVEFLLDNIEETFPLLEQWQSDNSNK